MEHTPDTTLLPLLLVSILAFLIPILTSWFSKTTKLPVPAVVGEIICGIIIGKSFLGLIDTTDSIPWLAFLSLFGFTYLMFLSGLEIDFGIILSESTVNRIRLEKRKLLKQPLIQAFAYFAITLILSTFVALFLYHQNLINSWAMMTLILSTTSVSVVVPIIKEKMLSKTLLGQTILLSALAADFLTMVMITIIVAVHTKKIAGNSFLIMFLIGIFIFVFYKLHLSKTFDGVINKFLYFRPIINELSHATTQIKVRGAIALMVLFIVMSQLLGFEVILGAFLAGILATLVLGESKTHQLEMKLDAIGYGFFIPIFFISVGIDIDLNVFFSSDKAWLILIFLIISAFAIKIIPSLVFTFNFSLKNSLSAGVLLSSRLSLIIAASTIGLKQGLISEEVNAAVVMVAVITCILSPVIFNHMYSVKKELKREKICIVGAGMLARMLVEDLLYHKPETEIALIAFNQKEFFDAKKRGLPVIMCGENMQETLINSNISKAKSLVATTSHDDYNLSICISARNNFGVKSLISIVNETKNISLFREQQIEPINKINKAVESITNMIISPDGYVMFSGHEEDVKVADVWLTNNSYNNIAIKNITLPGNTLIVHIKREYEGIIPHGDTELKLNDHITIAGAPKNVDDSIRLLGEE
ncbi:MAG: cation:proton antiporter [Cyanobacteriota bacterium]